MQTPIATDSMVLNSLPTRNARYRPQPTAVIIAGGTHGEPTATGIATLVNDASPRVIVATSGERALPDDVRSRCAEGVAPTWVLVGLLDLLRRPDLVKGREQQQVVDDFQCTRDHQRPAETGDAEQVAGE